MTLAELLAKLAEKEAQLAAAAVDSAELTSMKSQIGELQTQIKTLQTEAMLAAQKSLPITAAATSAPAGAFEAMTATYAKIKAANPHGSSVSFSVKSALTVQGVGGAYGPGFNQPTYIPGITPAPAANLAFLDFIPVAPAESDVVHETRELAFVNGATYVLDGEAGDESSISLQEVSVSVKRVSTTLPISEKALQNNDVAAITNKRLSEGLARKRKAAILGGAAAAPESFDGLLAPGNYVAYAPSAAVSKFDELVNHLATAFDDVGGTLTELVVASDLWADLVNAKDTTGRPLYIAEGTYADGKSFKWKGSNGSTLTIFREATLPAGKFIAANLGEATVYYARKNAEIQVGQTGDDFKKHMCTIRAAEEGVLFVRKPYLIHYGTAF